MAELNSSTEAEWPAKPKIYTIKVLQRKSLLTPYLEQCPVN